MENDFNENNRYHISVIHGDNRSDSKTIGGKMLLYVYR